MIQWILSWFHPSGQLVVLLQKLTRRPQCEQPQCVRDRNTSRSQCSPLRVHWTRMNHLHSSAERVTAADGSETFECRILSSCIFKIKQ